MENAKELQLQLVGQFLYECGRLMNQTREHKSIHPVDGIRAIVEEESSFDLWKPIQPQCDESADQPKEFLENRQGKLCGVNNDES